MTYLPALEFVRMALMRRPPGSIAELGLVATITCVSKALRDKSQQLVQKKLATAMVYRSSMAFHPRSSSALWEAVAKKRLAKGFDWLNWTKEEPITEWWRVSFVGSPSVLAIDLSDVPCSDENLAVIARCGVERLNLAHSDADYSDITDVGVEALGKYCIALESLNLTRCKRVGDVGVAALRGCTSLKGLVLAGLKNLTDEGAVALADLAQLESLSLRECRKLTSHSVRRAAVRRRRAVVAHRARHYRALSPTALPVAPSLRTVVAHRRPPHPRPLTNRPALGGSSRGLHEPRLARSGRPEKSGRYRRHGVDWMPAADGPRPVVFEHLACCSEGCHREVPAPFPQPQDVHAGLGDGRPVVLFFATFLVRWVMSDA